MGAEKMAREMGRAPASSGNLRTMNGSLLLRPYEKTVDQIGLI
jgi:hypothetical protein